MPVPSMMAEDRKYHWLRKNHLTRSPHRWIVMDSEAHRRGTFDGEVQTFRLAAAKRWHDTAGEVRQLATKVFYRTRDLWEWVGEFTRKGMSTVLWCHNLDYDIQLTDAFVQLPLLGWKLVWSNLDQQVSMAKWTRDGATLKMADTHSWIPKPLEYIGGLLGIGKPLLPDEDDSAEAWETRCVADVEITYCMVQELLHYIRTAELGNMQFSGAGMGYAMWRHKYLDEKILVHADEEAIEAERSAMHTGRAEVWRYGVYRKTKLYEWDLSNAYTVIARDYDLPRQLIKHDPAPTMGRYQRWARKWRVLVECRITTEVPCVPVREDERELWPVGTFTTVLWDTEVQLALDEGATVEFIRCWAYLRGPIMRSWAEHTLDVLHGDHPEVTPLVKVWYKHQARATIGRCGLRYTVWDEVGPDWIGMTGISTMSRDGGKTCTRLLHIGGDVWEETGKVEGRDSMPMIPSWVAAQCRVQLWRAMRHAGLPHVYYVDTDSILTDRVGHARMIDYAMTHPGLGWRIKGIYRGAELYGPRQIVLDGGPRIAGVPKRARRTDTDTFEGEVWQRAGAGLAAQASGSVGIRERTWTIAWTDRRRLHLPGGLTDAIELPGSTPEHPRQGDGPGNGRTEQQELPEGTAA